MSDQPTSRSNFLPNTAPAAGEPLWGGPPRKQPIVPLIALAFITLLVAAPTAFSAGGSSSSNPIELMHSIAKSTYEMTGTLDKTNKLLGNIDGNTQPLGELNGKMTKISAATKSMNDKTQKLNVQLAEVGGSVSNSGDGLLVVDGELTKTSAALGGLKGAVDGSLASTQQIVGDFSSINRNIGAMDGNLASVIRLMDVSAPATKAFATNKTVLSVAGGDGTRFNAPNIVAGSRVMSVVLPMINTMQNGGPMVARKDSHTASNPLINFALKNAVPNGANVISLIRKYDGQYGMPGPDYFVNNRVGGF